MRLASFHAHGLDRIGFEVEPGRLVDAADVLRALPGAPAAAETADMMAVIRSGDTCT